MLINFAFLSRVETCIFLNIMIPERWTDKKAKIVLEVLREEKTLNEIAAEYEIHPNMVSRWKAEFINNAASKGKKIKRL